MASINARKAPGKVPNSKRTLRSPFKPSVKLSLPSPPETPTSAGPAEDGSISRLKSDAKPTHDSRKTAPILITNPPSRDPAIDGVPSQAAKKVIKQTNKSMKPPQILTLNAPSIAPAKDGPISQHPHGIKQTDQSMPPSQSKQTRLSLAVYLQMKKNCFTPAQPPFSAPQPQPGTMNRPLLTQASPSFPVHRHIDMNWTSGPQIILEPKTMNPLDMVHSRFAPGGDMSHRILPFASILTNADVERLSQPMVIYRGALFSCEARQVAPDVLDPRPFGLDEDSSEAIEIGEYGVADWPSIKYSEEAWHINNTLWSALNHPYEAGECLLGEMLSIKRRNEMRE
jgi:hypothetical protein